MVPSVLPRRRVLAMSVVSGFLSFLTTSVCGLVSPEPPTVNSNGRRKAIATAFGVVFGSASAVFDPQLVSAIDALPAFITPSAGSISAPAAPTTTSAPYFPPLLPDGPMQVPTKSQERKMKRIQDLQDNRLEQCPSDTDNFDQCFFYGTGVSVTTERGKYLPTRSVGKSGPPTW